MNLRKLNIKDILFYMRKMGKDVKRYVSKHAAKKEMKRLKKDQPRKKNRSSSVDKPKKQRQSPKLNKPSQDIRDKVVFSMPKGNYPRLVLSGNSNVGKSSITKLILSHPSLYKGKIGKTAGSTIKLNLINDKEQKFHLIDLPGLGHMLRFSKKEMGFVQKQIVEYFETDKKNIFLTLVIANVLRIEDEIEKWHEKNPNTIPLTFEFIKFLEELQVPCVLILNKCDKVSNLHLERIKTRVVSTLDKLEIIIQEKTKKTGLLGLYYTSARTGDGIDSLKIEILKKYNAFLIDFEKEHGPIDEIYEKILQARNNNPQRSQDEQYLDSNSDEDDDYDSYADDDYDSDEDNDYDSDEDNDYDSDEDNDNEIDVEDDDYDEDVDEGSDSSKAKTKSNVAKLDIVSIRRQKIMLAQKRESMIKNLKKQGYSMNYIINYLENPQIKAKKDGMDKQKGKRKNPRSKRS